MFDPARGGIVSTNGIFFPTIVLDGRVAGTWKRELKKDSVIITLSPFAPLAKKERQAIALAAERSASSQARDTLPDSSASTSD